MTDRSPRARILYVEDHADTRFLMEHVLQDLYDVTAVSTAEGAIELSREGSYDLVIVDINLRSELTGADVLKAYRRSAEYAGTPILALTAYALPGDRERFLDMGFDAYMSKPFAVDELLELIAQMLVSSSNP